MGNPDTNQLNARFKLNRRLITTEDATTVKQISEQLESTPLNQLNDVTIPRNVPSVCINRTTITIKKQFMPRHLNFAGIVFGGDILQTLESAATTAAGRLLSTKGTPVTARIRSLIFIRPVKPKQLMIVQASVVASWSSTVCVMIRASVDDPFDKTILPSHAGVFFITNNFQNDQVDSNDRVSCGVRVRVDEGPDGNSKDETQDQLIMDKAIAMAVASDIDVLAI